MMYRWWGGVVMLALAACGLAAPEAASAPVSDSAEVPLRNFGPAPELTNETWLNTDTPLRLADLRGKVVLVDMWTFG
jgi:hypothetical protein